ncbi:hypothetical protein J4Q44_G00248170 [Coregonus suidteri]|uniref:Uncharacterized protein n=1 Tax=Coregonus suidteri TaxID=861788 RepID=A0AAN8LMU9_9TELE
MDGEEVKQPEDGGDSWIVEIQQEWKLREKAQRNKVFRLLFMDLPQRRRVIENLREMDDPANDPVEREMDREERRKPGIRESERSMENIRVNKRSEENKATAVETEGLEGDRRGKEVEEMKKGCRCCQGDGGRGKEKSQSRDERKEEQKRYQMIVEMQRIRSNEEKRERETFLRNREREEKKREDEERMRERAHLAEQKRDADRREREVRRMEREIVEKRKEVDHRVMSVNRKVLTLRPQNQVLRMETQGVKTSIKQSADQGRQESSVKADEEKTQNDVNREEENRQIEEGDTKDEILSVSERVTDVLSGRIAVSVTMSAPAKRPATRVTSAPVGRHADITKHTEYDSACVSHLAYGVDSLTLIPSGRRCSDAQVRQKSGEEEKRWRKGEREPGRRRGAVPDRGLRDVPRQGQSSARLRPPSLKKTGRQEGRLALCFTCGTV